MSAKRCTDTDYVHISERSELPKWLWTTMGSLITILIMVIGYLSSTGLSAVREDIKLKADKAIVDIQIQNVNTQIADMKGDVGEMKKDIKQILYLSKENKKMYPVDKKGKEQYYP